MIYDAIITVLYNTLSPTVIYYKRVNVCALHSPKAFGRMIYYVRLSMAIQRGNAFCVIGPFRSMNTMATEH